MAVAYFDCFAGASGDMILGALLDAGLPLDQLSAELAKLGLPGYTLSADRIVKQGFAATKFGVKSPETGRPVDHVEDEHEHPHKHAHPHRHLADIRGLIESAPIAGRAKGRAIEVFTRLAEAEAAAHGVDIEAVHFHEVGAVDAIVDIVGACIAVELLGIDRVLVSPLPPGSGTVKCAHGLMPVPTPATAALLKGVPLAANANPGELLTPTGAAILTTLADEYVESIPAGLKIVTVGVGAGTRDGANVPNLLRVMLCERTGPETGRLAEKTGDTVVLMETNLDDLDGVAIGHCFGLLLDAGALDVWATPITMKKNRPAYMLSVLVEPGSPAEAACRTILFSQTSTFGLREQTLSRTILARAHEVVQTPYGPIRIKVGRLGDTILQSQPEYEDCREAATRTGESLTEVRRAALAAYRERQS
ncbi:MAG: nickel pincer cofactor biosynthesis protein LarC [Phycisphaerae bacterium]|nr:nickel pincer cofactor biosynthesis protein LarC [Phycisphaerae bacterium]